MSAYKQFSTKDVIITPFTANKGFNFIGNNITGSDVGINILSAFQPPNNNLISDANAGSNNTDDGSKAISSLQWPHFSTTSGSLFLGGFKPQRNIFTIYSSTKQLFYTNYLSQSFGDNALTRSLIPGVTEESNEFVGGVHSPNFDNYLQSTLIQSRSFALGENLPTISYRPYGSIISIPSKLYGDFIEPQSFKFTYTGSGTNAFVDYVCELFDDGDGNIFTRRYDKESSFAAGVHFPECLVGNIFYDKGLVVLSSFRLSGSLTGSNAGPGNAMPNFSLGSLGGDILKGQPGYTAAVGRKDQLLSASISFSSSVKIYEHQYKCHIRDNEFTYTLNPTVLSSSFDQYIEAVTNDFTGETTYISQSLKKSTYSDFATGSYFSPYITTIGLYDNNKQLLAIGKLSRPTKIPSEADLTIQINFDM